MKNKRKLNFANKEITFKKETAKLKNNVFTYSSPLSIAEFAKITNIPVNQIIKHFFMKGEVLNLNSTLDSDQIGEICLENNLDFKKKAAIKEDNFFDANLVKDTAKEKKPRPCIITIMGHVDHGKTTLVDFIRKSNVAAGEAGGITQSVSAYQLTYQNQVITLLDTPGHEAFTEMRLRGSQVTDIVVIIIAADDGVMQQTREAISHALAAKLPIIVFVNKMDKVDNFNEDKFHDQLSSANLITEKWGGDVPVIKGSALKGDGVKELFEAILLQSEMLELKANPNRMAYGTVIESSINRAKGALSTLIVQNGTLKKRDFIVAGGNFGKIRSMESTTGKLLEEAGPSTPVVISGLNENPEPGTRFVGFLDEKLAKQLAKQKAEEIRSKNLSSRSNWKANLADLKTLNILIKTNISGSAEAIKNALSKINNEEVQINLVHAAAGAINKSDILLASSAGAIILGFNVRPSQAIRNFAKDHQINIYTYSVIYKLIEEIEGFVQGMLAPKYEEKVFGLAKVLKVFYSSKIGNIAGSKVDSGVIKSGSKMRLIRDGVVVYEGEIASLNRNQDAVKEVKTGLECGIVLKKYNDIKEGDLIETYADVEIAKDK